MWVAAACSLLVHGTRVHDIDTKRSIECTFVNMRLTLQRTGLHEQLSSYSVVHVAGTKGKVRILDLPLFILR